VIHPKHCKRCGCDWNAKIENPRYCPLCKSPYWDKDKVRFPKETKEKNDEGVFREDRSAIDTTEVLNMPETGDVLAIPR
jgi:hypothetical protein